MSQNKLTDSFQLRLPSELRQKLRVRAELNRRSLNSEIVFCLEGIIGETKDLANGEHA